MAFSAVSDRDFNVGVLHGLGADINHEFIGNVNLFEFNFDDDLLDVC